MHSETAGDAPKARVVLCPVDGTSFTPTRSWQKFCSTDCRNKYHHSMTPEALRRDLDDVKAELAALREQIEGLTQARETAPA